MTLLVTSRRIPAAPRASAMLEALRGLGYSPATAIADIVDNSIAAQATTVDVCFTWAASASRVTIADDGRGMLPDELQHAMRLGGRNPLDERRHDDLGRFGLGLKTASLSQCRRLTVASKRGGLLSCLRWDLDEIAAAGGGEWHLLEGPAHGSEDLLAPLATRAAGTLVAWEVVDRLVTTRFREQDMLDLVDHVERHLAMVFHRFLEGPRPRLRIRLNGCDVRPWNPFLEEHRDTWSSPEERIASADGSVLVRCHVLPHKDRLDTRTYEAAAGPEGWTAQQGFYVYRQDRLLLGGSWLGLGRGRSWTKEEAHRLARIRLDIGNTADRGWKIDVRKSTAHPPVEIRNRLSTLAQDTRDRARRVFAWRGKVVPTRRDQPVAQAWAADHLACGVKYRIDERHPAVAAVLEQAGALAPQIRAMLRIVEETVPVQRIWLDTAERRETPRTGFAAVPSEEVRQVLDVMYRNLVGKRGLPPKEAKERLLLTEPFDAYPDLVWSLPDVVDGIGG